MRKPHSDTRAHHGHRHVGTRQNIVGNRTEQPAGQRAALGMADHDVVDVVLRDLAEQHVAGAAMD